MPENAHKRLLPVGAEIVLATHNKGKIREFMKLLAPYNIKVHSAGDFRLAEPDETEDNFEGNAALKAFAAAKATNLPALADDSGFCVAALGGLPGIYSARWAGPERDMKLAMQRVHDEMVASNSNDQSGSFVTVLCLAWPDGVKQFVRAEVAGRICWPPRGEQGHGYDPMFIPEGQNPDCREDERTFGEMSDEEKNRYSHRAVAIHRFIAECLEKK
ncbi:RdgB/HAM1 family non-canonical purine NTP pyrophosphatase [Aristophania vespae]|uniref:dITP/XTP pyrophosphatase n=1 Tax=Aristophania vespae TaxID=2697033 RepID=A0A6P1NEY3_9PROT|nr:RdgB/HAM1 family non-canonical purine NTP pyrophosphatase [Aristophania vespae]QHI96018.1 RdgB/HAM1 family non-canonical purine NTP pyrophosphatase [Aristophania vespae]UMM63785.1 dITP/XTP pyrophosphatase [Aristophania vespae]